MMKGSSKSECRNPKSEADDLLELGVVVAAGALPKVVQRAKELLDGLPAGKVLSTASLVQRLGVNGRNSMNHPALKPYRILLPCRRVYYGSAKTVRRASGNIQQPKGK